VSRRLLLDACAILDLVKVDRLDLLRALPEGVATTDAVWEELAGEAARKRWPKEVAALEAARRGGDLDVLPVDGAAALRFYEIRARRRGLGGRPAPDGAGQAKLRSHGEDSLRALVEIDPAWTVVSADAEARRELAAVLDPSQVWTGVDCARIAVSHAASTFAA
jgi:predicted nucleic acid-binding protein